MRNAVVIIYRSVERIDHPLKFARLIADDSLFAIECVLRKFFEQRLRDQFLGADIDFKFNIVLGGLIHLHRFLEIVPEHFPGGTGRFNGGVEIMPHERLARTNRRKCTRKTALNDEARMTNDEGMTKEILVSAFHKDASLSNSERCLPPARRLSSLSLWERRTQSASEGNGGAISASPPGVATLRPPLRWGIKKTG